MVSSIKKKLFDRFILGGYAALRYYDGLYSEKCSIISWLPLVYNILFGNTSNPNVWKDKESYQCLVGHHLHSSTFIIWKATSEHMASA